MGIYKTNSVKNWYYKNGNLRRQVYYNNGKKELVYKKYYEDGGLCFINN